MRTLACPSPFLEEDENTSFFLAFHEEKTSSSPTCLYNLIKGSTDMLDSTEKQNF